MATIPSASEGGTGHLDAHNELKRKVDLLTVDGGSTGDVLKQQVDGTFAPDTDAGGATVDSFDDLPTTVPLYIVETSTGTWTSDAPSRTVGEFPCIFVGGTDPTDVTNGVTTPANINSGDVWMDSSA